MRGFSNLISRRAHAHRRRVLQQLSARQLFHASPWTARDVCIANSPFFALDRVTMPLLLLPGQGGISLARSHAREIFVAPSN
jgi:hypothetical protein